MRTGIDGCRRGSVGRCAGRRVRRGFHHRMSRGRCGRYGCNPRRRARRSPRTTVSILASNHKIKYKHYQRG